jgi:hypothetical protein
MQCDRLPTFYSAWWKKLNVASAAKNLFLKLYKYEQHVMTALDPNMLNPSMLLGPNAFQVIDLIITVPSVVFACLISWHFFRSYRFSGFGYLLGLPVGFVFLALSFLFQYLNLIFSNDQSLYPIFFWIQLASQSEALALIAISYHFKSKSFDNYSIHDINFVPAPKINSDRTFNKTKKLVSSSVPLIMIAIPFVVPVYELVSEPGFTYYGLADLSLFLRFFNMTVLCYIFINSVISLVKAASIKFLYIPGAFALLWLEQYSLAITYFENNTIAYLGSTIARLAGLTLFVYIVYTITSRGSRRNMQIETREKT